MTAEEAAKDLIEVYVKRGDTPEQLRAGHQGYYSPEYSAGIGGLAGDKYYNTNFIVVHSLGGKEVNIVFKFQDIYDKCKAGQVTMELV